MKYPNPYSTRNEAMWRFDISKEISEKIRVIKDPETWEIVKKDETKLDEWVEHLIIPTINSCLRKEWDAFWSIGTETKIDWTPVDNTPTINLTEKIKKANEDDDLSDLPF
jgi:hypothetical protein